MLHPTVIPTIATEIGRRGVARTMIANSATRAGTLWGPVATWIVAAGAAVCGTILPAHAGDRLLGTWGVTQAEGTAGGGLSPWALIAGSGSRDQSGVTAFATHWRSQGGYTLRALGAAVGWHDTLELSAAQWRFGLSDTVPGASIRLDSFGIKWRAFGDAVYDQDRWWPQVAFGAIYKKNHDMAVPTALGARRADDTDVYLAATKVWLAGLHGRNVLLNLTVRSTRANQFGLLGFGGDRRDARHWKVEAAAAVLLRDDLALGVEWRDKPDALSAVREQPASDVFVAWFINHHLSATLAWLDLGQIANKSGQRGAYVSVQAAF